jgi:hypothetical protein
VTRLFGGRLPPLVVGLVLAAVGAAVADPLQDGSSAYQRKDYEAALNLWRPIAEQGNPEAQRWLGRLHDSGLGVPKDPAKAAFWYRYAAEQGDTYAQSRLGQMYILGGDTITRDTGIGLMWLKKAADQGDASDQRFLGNLYSDGMWGVPKDEAQATAWYRKAADQGDRGAMMSLSTAALSRKDYPEALAPLFNILAEHRAALKCQFDAFAEYVAAAEKHGVENYPLYEWTKATIENPAKQEKYLKSFALYVDDREVYAKEIADALEADLQPLATSGLITRISKYDTNPANNPQSPQRPRERG